MYELLLNLSFKKTSYKSNTWMLIISENRAHNIDVSQ